MALGDIENLGSYFGGNAGTSGTGFNSDFASKLSAGMGAGSLLQGLFGGNNFQNPANAAQGYYNKIPNTIAPYFSPFINQGQKSNTDVNKIYQDLITNPGSLMTRLSQGFKTSPGYNFALNQGENAINNAAAAGGMLGTPEQQLNAGNFAGNAANSEYNNYINRILQMFGQGVAGEQGNVTRGYDASRQMGEDLAATLMNQGNIAEQGVNAQNQQNETQQKDIFGGLGAMVPWIASLFAG